MNGKRAKNARQRQAHVLACGRKDQNTDKRTRVRMTLFCLFEPTRRSPRRIDAGTNATDSDAGWNAVIGEWLGASAESWATITSLASPCPKSIFVHVYRWVEWPQEDQTLSRPEKETPSARSSCRLAPRGTPGLGTCDVRMSRSRGSRSCRRPSETVLGKGLSPTHPAASVRLWHCTASFAARSRSSGRSTPRMA